MSRLDSFIRRLEAQRLVLNWAGRQIAKHPGLVLELGLGNGRTYDHLREMLPGRAIHVFERRLSVNPRSMPPADMLVLGDMRQTLPVFALRHGRNAVLIHVDATTGVPERDRVDLAWLPGHVAALAADGALVIAGAALEHPTLTPTALPEGVPAERYFAYLKQGETTG
jgi:hypothetical protein